ncbi:hypothetical protein ANCDUO_08217 [Ancylostoma duodenale]|uniref:Uncharacterized protein n=1 Tax=Ancylostoma duodenale TaxID=51022 RepID=A0A0C2DGD0_9BILA|nr:hypothetical protein ANCDUO_08217 [Ancylostoma duodenale]
MEYDTFAPDKRKAKKFYVNVDDSRQRGGRVFCGEHVPEPAYRRETETAQDGNTSPPGPPTAPPGPAPTPGPAPSAGPPGPPPPVV